LTIAVMELTAHETALYFSAWLPLLDYVNRRRSVVPGVVIARGHAVDPDDTIKVRDALWAEESLLDDFLRENPAELSAEALALASSWRHRHAGTFVIYRCLKRHAVVLDDQQRDLVFAVHGITTPIEAMVPWLPYQVKGVLLPFGDRIVFDGLMVGYSIRFGPGIRASLDDAYQAAKDQIITTLVPPASASKPAAKASKPAAAKASKPAAAKASKPQQKKVAAAEKELVAPGKCLGCGEVFSKRAIGRHLDACVASQLKGKAAPTPQHRLIVESPGMPEYWLHVEVGDATPLKELDALLRSTWLECCGHLSAFKIGGSSYAAMVDHSGWGVSDERSMAAKVREFMGVPKWSYEYDYGTTTLLRVRPAGTHLGRGRGARLLARNVAPRWDCMDCGAPATEICVECVGDSGGGLCAACAEAHGEIHDAFLPVVNSPRAGQCGYTG
jgi:hypothetical protein